MFRATLRLATVFALTLTPTLWAQNLIRLYVQAGNGEFASNGANDTALDLIKAIQGKSKILTIVDSAANADLLLRVDKRDTRTVTTSVSTYANESKDGKSASATTIPSKTTYLIVHSTLIAGDFQMEIVKESSLSWRLAAGETVSQVERWARENGAKLIAKRPENSGGQPAPPAPAAQPAAPAAPAKSEEASITLGMTPEEVLKAMGEPEKKVTFGKRSLWNYRGMQVVFEDGKVTDVKF